MGDVYSASWSESDADNNQASPNGAPEGMQPGGLNNTMRMMMGALKRLLNQFIPKITTGTSTAYVLSYGVAPTALVDGMTFLVEFHTASGVTPTLNVNSLGATPLHTFQGGAWGAPSTGRIPAGFVARVTYKGAGAFRILRPLGTAADYDVGTGANNVVKLDGDGQLPGGIGLWSTADVRLTFRTAAATGWLMFDDGTIGDGSSGADHTGTDYQAVYTALWNAVSSPSSNAWCAVTGGLGANAAADWAAHKKMALPKVLGRALGIAGTGSGLTARVLGSNVGVEEAPMTIDQLIEHKHPSTDNTGGGVPVSPNGGGSSGGQTGNTGQLWFVPNTGNAGEEDPDPISKMQPTFFLNAEIKL